MTEASLDPAPLFAIAGRVAIVTGGASGIGEAVAMAYAAAGARVTVLDLSEANRAAAAGRFTATGLAAHFAGCDVADGASVETAMASIEAREGRIDILFHAAGTAFRGMAVDHSPEDFARVIAVNLNGSFNACLAVGRRMIARGEGGKIVLMGSIRGEVASPFGSTAYCTSKGGVHMLGRQLATEWAPHRICVNCLSPQMIETPFVASTLGRPGVRETYLSRIPMGRLGTTGDLIGAAVFLASPASDFVTGHTMMVDGGSLAG